MKNAIIVHGWGANAQSNWFPWLKQKLQEQGYKVAVPDFPNTERPRLAEWLAHFKQNTGVDENTILIGHSLGVPFILRLLESFGDDQKVKAAFLVSGFAKSLGNAETDNFVSAPFNFRKIRQSVGQFFVIHSDNDPYIPLEVGKGLAQKLGAELTIERGAGHINAPGDYLAYPRLLEMILSVK